MSNTFIVADLKHNFALEQEDNPHSWTDVFGEGSLDVGSRDIIQG